MKNISFNQVLEQKLKSIDDVFAEKKPSERIIILLMPILIFGAVAYLYAIPYSEEQLQKATSEQIRLKGQRDSAKAYITQVNATQTKENLKADIDKLMQEMDRHFNIQDEAEAKISQIIRMQDEWHVVLDFIANNAKQHDLDVTQILSEISTDAESVDFENIEVTIEGSGRFKNIMQFINDVEKYGIFLEINEVAMKRETAQLNFVMVTKGRRAIL